MKFKNFLVNNIGIITVKKEKNLEPDESGCYFSIELLFTYKKMPVSFSLPYQYEAQQDLVFNSLTQETVENIVKNFIVAQLGYN